MTLWTRLERKTVELAFYGLTAPSPVGKCYSWQFRYHQKSADFLVTRFCVIGDVTVSGLGELVDCCVLVCAEQRKKPRDKSGNR